MHPDYPWLPATDQTQNMILKYSEQVRLYAGGQEARGE